MKRLLMFASLLFSLPLAAQTDSLVSISYTSFGMTTGFNLEVNKKKIFYVESRRQPRELTYRFMGDIDDHIWNDLMRLVSDLDLDSLNKFIPPTAERDTDGALYAKLTIKTTHKTYQTSDFDEGYPMKEIAALISAIDNLINHRLLLPPKE